MSEQRYENLDRLRGLAALAVLYTHFFYTFGRIWPEYRTAIPSILQISFADAAVRMFFVISGIVILLSLERSKGWKDFVVSRATRIYPAYWACVLTTFVVLTAFPIDFLRVETWQALVNLTLLQQVFGVRDVDVVYWTLFVELNFYFWGVVVLALGTPPRSALSATLWMFVCLHIVDHYTDAVSGLPRLSYRLAQLFLFENAGFFLAGVVIYRVRTQGWKIADGLMLATCFADFFLIASTPTQFFSNTLLPVALPALALWYRRPLPDGIGLKRLGEISYPLYLIHAHVGFTIMWYSLENGMPVSVAIAAASGITVVLATVISVQVEYPATRRLRQKWRARAGESPVAPVVAMNDTAGSS